MKKKRAYAEIIFFIVSLGLSILAFPVAFLMGGFATDAPGSGMKEFLFGFMFIEAFPILLVISSILLWIKKAKKLKVEKDILIKEGEK